MKKNCLVLIGVLAVCLIGLAGYAAGVPSDTIKVYPTYAPADSATPFAIYNKCVGLTLPYIRIKIYDYKGLQTGNDLTWGDSTYALSGPPVWTLSNSAVYGYKGNAKYTAVGGAWQGWLVGKVTGDSADLRVRFRQEDADSIRGTNYTWTNGQQKLNMQTNGGWIKGHIYQGDDFIDGLQNSAVLAYQGASIVGIYLTENNSINEDGNVLYDSTNAGFFRMAVPVGNIDSLQIRDLSNNIITGFWKTTAPWYISAASTRDIDAVGVAGHPSAGSPVAFKLNAASPNPASRVSAISYSLSRDASVSLRVFNMLGQQVATLAAGFQTAGTHQVRWSLMSDKGVAVPNGVYFYALTAGTQKDIRKLIVVR